MCGVDCIGQRRIGVAVGFALVIGGDGERGFGHGECAVVVGDAITDVGNDRALCDVVRSRGGGCDRGGSECTGQEWVRIAVDQVGRVVVVG